MLTAITKRTPIAWLQVTHQPVKMAVAIAGVCFSNLLMFFQLGLMDGLYNSQRRPIERMEADLVMVSSKYVSLSSLVEFQRSRLYQILGVPGVEYVSPLRIGRTRWLNPDTRKTYDIYVYGVNATYPSLDFPELEKNLDKLKLFRNALFDRNSKDHFGDVEGTIARKEVFQTELDGKRINLIDTFAMGATFAADGNMICNDSTFLYLFPKQKPEWIQIGLIKLKPGISAETVKASAKTFLVDDVKVLTKQEFSQLELNYWRKTSSVGTIFSIGTIVGFIVGAIIVYQILYSDVTASLAQYATMKAMGYTDSFVISVVIQQSAILAVIGFVPGITLSMVLYNVLANATKLAIEMSMFNAILVLVLTFVMCVGSGSIATRKLVELDPADVF